MFNAYGLSESDYTIFGQVISGMDVVNGITLRNPDDNPDYLGDVIVLRDMAQMPYSQVADILGITPAAARVYRHKAIKLLALRMSQSENREEL